MRGARGLFFAAAVLATQAPALAVEGPTVAGPIGGTDIRSAVVPPPGVYGGLAVAIAGVIDFVDGDGDPNPVFRHANLKKQIGGPFVYYVPDVKVLGGSVGLGAVFPMGNQCGRLFAGERNECKQGFGDPYAEIHWSRNFGMLRPSKYPGANPILQGLSVLVGFGMVFPAGTYDASTFTNHVLSIGTNIWDFAPSVGVTYTTPPIIGEGTEFSAKLFWNNYIENPETHFWTGDLINIDFAITEHIGRFQVGVAGVYGTQLEADELFGVPLPQIKAEAFLLGPIVNYDMPERASAAKLKVLRTIYAENLVTSWSVVLSWAKRF